jgi:pimeloyl-ACP methyl ester carboxylesterase
VRDLADTDLTAALAESDAPVLILQGSEDAWTSPESARALVQQLPAARAGSVTLRMLDGVDHHLADPAGQRPLAPDALAALFQWLAGLPARSPAGE